MISLSIEVGPYGIPVAIAQPPNELLGEFLTAEGGSIDSWACTDLINTCTDVSNMKMDKIAINGDAHYVCITQSKVRIQSEYRDPSAELEISLMDFLSALKRWRSLLQSQD